MFYYLNSIFDNTLDSLAEHHLLLLSLYLSATRQHELEGVCYTLQLSSLNTYLLYLVILTGADPEGVHGVRSNPPARPRF